MTAATMGRATRRVAEQQNAEQRRREKEIKRAQKQLQKELKREAEIRGQLLVNCWTRLGEAHMPRNADISTNGRAVRKHKITRVKFARIFTSPERFWYQILISKRAIFGYKDMLPFGVHTKDLISEDTLFDLSLACGCIVKAVADARRGVWIIVERLQGVDGLPAHVGFQDILQYYPEDMSIAPVLLGIGEHRKAHFIDFASHPHWLIGGSTQGGKSNLVNHIISSLMRFTHPDDLRFVLIDLKELEFTFYKDSAHLEGQIIVNAQNAIAALEKLLEEMDRRKHLMSGEAKELSIWNKRHPEQKLPRIIVVIDEFAELMLASGAKVAKEITRLTTRMTNLGRAVGLHMIIATQRPDKTVLPRSIRINMPLIVAARVPSGYDSLVIIGSYDAATLPIHPGRMIYQSGSQRHFIQAPHITDDDVIEAVKISNGRKLGLIALKGHQPTLVPEMIVQFIYDLCGGSLSVEKLYKTFDPYAVPRAELKALIADILKEGRVVAFDRLYEVERYGHGYRLVMLYADDTQTEQAGTDFKFDRGSTLARLTAGAQLMLPAPKTPDPESTNEKPEIITVMAVPIEKTDMELIDDFIREHCVVGRTCKVLFAHLYAAYTKYSHEQEYLPVASRQFGQELGKRGYKPKKGSRGARYWLGIALVNEDNEEDVA